MKNQLQSLLDNIRNNELYILIGLALIGLGVVLWSNCNYFFYPPEYKLIMNDDGLDAFGVAIGAGLIIYGLIDEHSNKIAGVLLALAAFFVATITIMELIHVLAVHQVRMNVSIVSNIFLIAVIMYTAKNRDTKRQNKK